MSKLSSLYLYVILSFWRTCWTVWNGFEQSTRERRSLLALCTRTTQKTRRTDWFHFISFRVETSSCSCCQNVRFAMVSQSSQCDYRSPLAHFTSCASTTVETKTIQTSFSTIIATGICVIVTVEIFWRASKVLATADNGRRSLSLSLLVTCLPNKTIWTQLMTEGEVERMDILH